MEEITVTVRQSTESAAQASQLENACQEALAVFGPKATPLRDLARFAVNRMH